MKELKASNGHIPFGLVSNILQRLPAKSLMRFKCVSREWLALIRDPQFADCHYIHAQERADASHILIHISKMMFVERGGSTYILDDTILFPTNFEANFSSQLPTHTLSGCIPCTNIVNGLVCFFNHLKSLNKKTCRPYLLNITTGETVPLPEPKCDPNTLPFYLLGFDPIAKKHKVLQVRPDSKSDSYVCEILTVGTNSWRKLDCPSPENYWLDRWTVSANGAIYWVDKYPKIQFFDVGEEKFLELSDASVSKGIQKHNQGGKDFIFSVACKQHRLNTSSSLKLRALNTEEKFWLKDTIQIPDDMTLIPHIIGTTKTGEILLIGSPKKGSSMPFLVFYNLETRKFRTSEITCPPQIGPEDKYNFPKWTSSSIQVENILPLEL